MTEERITETHTPAGNTHTTHTIVSDGEAPRRGGAGWVIALVLILAAVAGLYLFSQQSGSEVAKNNAVAEAADSVSDAAGEVGTAAKNAGEAAKEAVDGQ